MKMTIRRGPLLCLAMLAALSGCAANPVCDDDQGSIDAVTLCPGASKSCNDSPCTIYYLMPDGSGDYLVTGNGIRIGEFPPGEKVNLGAYWESYYFDVVGADVARAYVFIGQTP